MPEDEVERLRQEVAALKIELESRDGVVAALRALLANANAAIPPKRRTIVHAAGSA